MPDKLLDLGESENLLVVSDVHMRTPDDDRTALFCKFLDQVGHSLKCDTLVLLGDIFDFFNARQSFYFHLWSKVFFKIRSLAARGVRVVFVEGNHDYGFEHSPCSQVKECFYECGDAVLKVFMRGQGDVVLLHSDDVVCPPSYRPFRSLVKSALFQALLAPVPGRVSSAVFSRYASLSRKKDDYRQLDEQFLGLCVDKFVGTLGPQLSVEPRVCVFGHIHVNLDDERHSIRFLSGPAWFTAASVLSISSTTGVERIWLQDPPLKSNRFTFLSGTAQTGPSGD